MLGHFCVVLKFEISRGSAERIDKSISAKKKDLYKCVAFSELTLQTLAYPFQFLYDKDFFSSIVTYIHNNSYCNQMRGQGWEAPLKAINK